MKKVISEVKKIGYDWFRAAMVFVFVLVLSQFVAITKAGSPTVMDKKVIDSVRMEMRVINKKLDYIINNNKK